MSNFRKFISLSAVVILGATNLLTPLSFASADEVNYGAYENVTGEAKAFRFIMPAHDVTFYAHTAANTYKVRFNGEGTTTGTMADQPFTYDASGSLTKNEYELIGHTFLGWNENQAGDGTPYADQQEVKNLTAVDNAIVTIYPQWDANVYNIHYVLNSGSHSETPSTGKYGQALTITGATRQGYIFSGWNITDMNGTHKIDGVSGEETTKNHVMATSFESLRTDTGTVNFAASWDPRTDTPYTVYHYLEKLQPVGDYITGDTDDLQGTTDENVTPAVKEYIGFDAATTGTQKIEADGSTVFQYYYPRQIKTLTLNAGRGIKSATAAGTVSSGDTVNAGDTALEIDFRYDEPITLSFVPSQGYQGGTWSGYENASGSFNMPAENIEKTAYATPIPYTITQECRGGSGCVQTTNYTIESGDITLPTPTRGEFSEFLGWTGGVNNEITTPDKNVTIASGSIEDRTYAANWSCVTGYHLVDTGSSTESCQPDIHVLYVVKYKTQNLDETTYTEYDSENMYGTSNTQTQVIAPTIDGFTLSGTISDYQTNIDREGKTVVEVIYNRNSYNKTITNAVGGEAAAITSPNANGANSEGEQIKYGDTVTLSAVKTDGYEFDYWEVKDESNETVVVNNSGNINGATFLMPSSAVTITPHVTQPKYTIHYELNNGDLTGGATNPVEYYVETATITLHNPERANSTFEGWSGTAISGMSGTVVIAKGSFGNRSYEANWSCNPGYHEVGNSCEPNTYTVTIDYMDEGDGATTNPTTTGFEYGKVIEIPNPTQSGYDFAGWTVTGLSGGNAKVNGVEIEEGQTGIKGTGFENLSVEVPGSVKLEAVWTAKTDTKYEVHHLFKQVGANTYVESGTLVETEYLSGETNSPLTLANLAKTIPGYDYTGGALSPSATLPASFTTTTNIAKDGTRKIYLYYSTHSYTVTIDPDDHTVAYTGAGTYEYGATVHVDMTPATGYHFVPWTKSGSGS